MPWDFLNSRASSARSLLNLQGLAMEFSLDGKSYHGIRKMLKRQDAETLAGLAEEQYSFSMLCDASQFASMPLPRRDKILFHGKAYRVLSVSTDPAGLSVELALGGIDQ